MNLYEFEGKQLFIKHGIAVPRGVVLRRGEDAKKAYEDLDVKDVVVKAQVLSGKRGKNNGIKFCSSALEVEAAVREMFDTQIRGQYVAAVLVEEKLSILEEQYVSIVYDTNRKQPMVVYSCAGGMDIEDVADHKIKKFPLDIHEEVIDIDVPYAQKLWDCFRAEDTRQVEINPLVKTTDGRFVAADAKVAIDDDAFYRHEERKNLEPRTMLGRLPTERELAVKKIDEGEAYYRGTAGKYIEMDGDIAILFSGGGASIANMDALIKCGLKPANYTEYSGNPPREKVAALAKIVLSKPGLRGLWIAGGVANFTNIADTFAGIVDAIDEVKPTYPIVVRRAGPSEEEGMQIMRECAERNNLHMELFGKEMSMSDSAKVLAEMVKINF
jgi:citryl-CoA synthetase large subunit